MLAPGDTSDTTIDIVAPVALLESTLILIGARRRTATSRSPSSACTTAPPQLGDAAWPGPLVGARDDCATPPAVTCRNLRRSIAFRIASQPLEGKLRSDGFPRHRGLSLGPRTRRAS